MYSTTFDQNGVNKIVLNYVFKPYYKLVLSGRYLPIYKSVSSTEPSISLKVRILDNSSEIFE